MSSKSPRETSPVDLARIAAEDARWTGPRSRRSCGKIRQAGNWLPFYVTASRSVRDNCALPRYTLCSMSWRLALSRDSAWFRRAGSRPRPTVRPARYDGTELVGSCASVLLISDRPALPLLEVGCDHLKLPRKILVEFPFEDGPPTRAGEPATTRKFSTETDRWIRDFFASDFGRSLTHLVSVERVGPCHTVGSLQSQPRDGAAPVEQFLRAVPAEDWNLCHDMRGRSINGLTAKTHRLFEWISEHRLPVTTIGIGDGGNEIGMGQFPWELMVAAGGTSAGRIACRIATDFALVAGVSNWGAYALALAIARLRGPGQGADAWDEAQQRRLIEAMLDQAGAVDGITLRAEATVDGLPLDAYLRPLTEMRGILGYDAKH